MALPKNDQRYYDVTRLNRWFALSSVLLLAVTLWLVVDDHSGPWKPYQRQFRALEVQKTRALLEEEKARLGESQELAALEDELAQARKSYAEGAAGLAKLEEARAVLARRTKVYEFARADYGELRYAYEEALAHGKADAEAMKENLGTKLSEREDLRLAVEASEKAAAELADGVAANRSALAALEQQKALLDKQLSRLERKLSKVDAKAMTWSNRLANWVRDLPILDLSSPYYTISQIVVTGLTEDVNFARVPRVDRCTTCHLGLTKPGFEDEAQPFGNHPNPGLYLSADSPHPIAEFGCTGCHRGRGRGTGFNSAAHTPSDAAEREAWEAAYGWAPYPHWEEPMYPLEYTEAGCLKCHLEETVIPGAEKLSLGLQLTEKAACFGCHAIEKFAGRPKVGPSVRHLAAKTSREWVFRWIDSPRTFRPGTWMPHFSKLSNSSDPESLARSAQEIHAVVEYLYANTEAFVLDEIPVPGDPERGKALVASLGCMGCHRDRDEDPPGEARLESLYREHGPHLTGLGTKTSKQWIYNWLSDPHRYNPKSKMPNLRLLPQEAADIAEYLAQDKREAFVEGDLPPVDEARDGILDDIVLQYLMQTQREEQARGALGGMDTKAKLVFAGEKLIRHWGCFACHDIPGFEGDLPIGTDLSEEGSKPVERLDFGFVEEIEHTKRAWYIQKLIEPRIFDRNRVKTPGEKLRMPDFAFSQAEAEALVTALMGFVKKDPQNRLDVPRTEANLFDEAGQVLVREFNCRGCHVIDGRGGAILPKVTEWLVEYEDRVEIEAEAVAVVFSAPNLIGEGKKVRNAWLFEFLHRPQTIRPWLKIRMPAFAFDNGQRNVLTKYFSVLDGGAFSFATALEPPLSGPDYEIGKLLFSKDYFDCGNCHIQGDKLPSGSPDRWAPDFALTPARLKPDWVTEWIYDPQKLQPGTKMPTYFDPESFDDSGPEDILDGDEHKHIIALRDYTFAIGLLNEASAAAGAVPEVSGAVPEVSVLDEGLPENSN